MALRTVICRWMANYQVRDKKIGSGQKKTAGNRGRLLWAVETGRELGRGPPEEGAREIQANPGNTPSGRTTYNSGCRRHLRFGFPRSSLCRARHVDLSALSPDERFASKSSGVNFLKEPDFLPESRRTGELPGQPYHRWKPRSREGGQLKHGYPPGAGVCVAYDTWPGSELPTPHPDAHRPLNRQAVPPDPEIYVVHDTQTFPPAAMTFAPPTNSGSEFPQRT